MKLKDITYRQFRKLPFGEQRDYADRLKFVAGEKVIAGRKARDLKKLKYSQVDLLRTEIYEHLSQAFWWVYGIDEAQLMSLSIMAFYQGLNFITEEVDNLTEMEGKLSELTMETQEMTEKRTSIAGLIEEGMEDEDDLIIQQMDLSSLGVFNVMDQLAVEYGTTPEEIYEWSWIQVYAKRKRNIILQNHEVHWQQLNRKRKGGNAA